MKIKHANGATGTALETRASSHGGSDTEEDQVMTSNAPKREPGRPSVASGEQSYKHAVSLGATTTDRMFLLAMHLGEYRAGRPAVATAVRWAVESPKEYAAWVRKGCPSALRGGAA